MIFIADGTIQFDTKINTEGFQNDAKKLASELESAFSGLGSGAQKGMTDAISTATGAAQGFSSVGQAAGAAMSDGIGQGFSPDPLLSAIEGTRAPSVSIGISVGTETGAGYAEGITSTSAQVQSSANTIAQSAKGELDNATSQSHGIGAAFGQGFANGISSAIGAAISAAAALAVAAVNAAKANLVVRSPSRVMKKVGNYFTQGFAEGISEESNHAKRAAKVMTEDAADSTKEAVEALFRDLEDLRQDSLITEEEFLARYRALRDIYYQEGSEEYKEASKKLYRDTRDYAISQLAFQHENGLIEEKAYYEALAGIRDTYFAVGSEEWLSYTAEIAQYQKESLEETYTSLLSYVEDAGEAVLKKQNAFTNKLEKFAPFTKDVSVDNWYPDGSALTFSELYDFGKKTEQLSVFGERLSAVREKLIGGGFDSDFISDFMTAISEMSIEEGMDFVSLLVGASDTDFTKYISGYKAYLAQVRAVSEDLFAPEYQKAADDAAEVVTQALLSAGYTVPPEFYDLGATSAEEFSRGFTEGLNLSFSWETDRIQKESFGGVSSVYSPVFHMYGANRTVTEQIQAARSFAERDYLAGGYGS